MHNKFVSILFLFFIAAATGCSNSASSSNQINFSGAFALYPLNIKWSEEYKKSHADIIMNIQAGGAGKGLADVINGNAEVGMFSREISSNELEKGVWYIALAKDAVLPTINSANPYYDILKSNGLTKQQLQNIFINGTPATWEELLATKNKIAHKINVYTRSDASGAAESWAAFFWAHQEKLKGLSMFGDPGIANAVKNDSNGIGYNNTHYVFDIATGKKIAGLEVLPLDVDGNGKIDSTENFYEDLDTILGAVLNGSYPSPPVRDLYFVCKQKPTDKKILDYFKWVLTDGQKFIKEAGYVPLPDAVVQEQLKKLE